MVQMASMQSGGYRYAIARDTIQGWYFIRAKTGTARAKEEYFPLDHDTRHARFFLTEEDQRYVGVNGLVALERLTRQILTR